MSPCGSPITMIPKKEGSWRMCIDYHTLNKITIKNRYPFPRIDELLDKMQQAKLFTKIDLKSGYHQVRIKVEDVWKIKFKKRQGLYEWFIMPFILNNAIETFMILMNDVIHPFIDSFVIVYLDEILIFINTYQDHSHM
jgi:hypothetical protein